MNDTNIRRFITSLDILQKWALNNNQLKKCAIELSACCIEDFRHYIHDDLLDIMGLLYLYSFNTLKLHSIASSCMHMNLLSLKLNHKFYSNNLPRVQNCHTFTKETFILSPNNLIH